MALINSRLDVEPVEHIGNRVPKAVSFKRAFRKLRFLTCPNQDCWRGCRGYICPTEEAQLAKDPSRLIQVLVETSSTSVFCTHRTRPIFSFPATWCHPCPRGRETCRVVMQPSNAQATTKTKLTSCPSFYTDMGLVLVEGLAK